MIARNHDGTDTRLLTFRDRRFHLGTNGVDHARKPDKREVFFDVLRLEILRDGIRLFIRRGKHAQRPVRHALVGRKDFLSLFVRQRHVFPADPHARTALENFVGRAFRILHDALRRRVNGGHHLTHTVEGRFGHSLVRRVQLRLVQAQLIGVIDEGAFGGVSLRLFRLPVEHRVRALRHRAGQKRLVLAVMIDDGHFVLRQRARLIRTDNLRAAQRLHGRQTFDHRFFLRHFRHAHGQDDRHHGRQPLGNRRHGQRHGHDKAVEHHLERKAPSEDQLESENKYADTQNDIAQDLGQLVETLLKRGDLVLRLRENVRDLAHFRLHAGRHDDDLLLSLGQSARLTGLAASAGAPGGDTHMDRAALRTFHHAAVFDQFRHAANLRIYWSGASAARDRRCTTTTAARAGTGSVSSRCA